MFVALGIEARFVQGGHQRLDVFVRHLMQFDILPVGEHDDAAFSFLLGVWFVLYGRNFGLYGIKPRDVLAAAPRGTDGEVTKEDLRKREVTVQLEGRAELLAEKINAAKGSPVAKKYIELIERINAELERNGSEVRNLDTLLESLNSRR